MLKELVADHESIVKSLRDNLDKVEEDYKDAGKSDLLNGLMQEQEKMAWKLRKYLKP